MGMPRVESHIGFLRSSCWDFPSPCLPGDGEHQEMTMTMAMRTITTSTNDEQAKASSHERQQQHQQQQQQQHSSVRAMIMPVLRACTRGLDVGSMPAWAAWWRGLHAGSRWSCCHRVVMHGVWRCMQPSSSVEGTVGEAHGAKTYVLAIILDDRAKGGMRCKGLCLSRIMPSDVRAWRGRDIAANRQNMLLLMC